MGHRFNTHGAKPEGTQHVPHGPKGFALQGKSVGEAKGDHDLDGSGQVVSVRFSQSFPGAAKAKALIVLWRLRRWTGGLAGSLEVTLG